MHFRRTAYARGFASKFGLFLCVVQAKYLDISEQILENFFRICLELSKTLLYFALGSSFERSLTSLSIVCFTVYRLFVVLCSAAELHCKQRIVKQSPLT